MNRSASPAPAFRGAPVDVVVDVRTRLEFWMGHLPGAVCIPVDQLPDGLAKHAAVAAGSHILVYCASGARSRIAAEQLRAAGYPNVVDGGGIVAAREHYTP